MIVARRGQQVTERHVNHCKRFQIENGPAKAMGVHGSETAFEGDEEVGDSDSVMSLTDPDPRIQSQDQREAAAVPSTSVSGRNLRDRSGLRKPARYPDVSTQ